MVSRDGSQTDRFTSHSKPVGRRRCIKRLQSSTGRPPKLAALFIGGGVRLERVYGKKREALEVWEAELAPDRGARNLGASNQN